MDRVVSPTPTPLSSGRVVPALVASYDMHGRAVGLFYTQPTGQVPYPDTTQLALQLGCPPCSKQSMVFFFICVHSYISGVHHFCGDCYVCDRFFNPTMEVVIIPFRGWCMLDVYLLLAFTCPGHECQDFLRLCDVMHVCTDKTSVYTLIRKSFGETEIETMLTPRGKSLLHQAQRRL